MGFEEERIFVEGVFGCGEKIMEANDRDEKVVFEAENEVSFLKGGSFVGEGERRQSIDSIDKCKYHFGACSARLSGKMF